MLKVFVLESRAEARQALVESLRGMLAAHKGEVSLLPRIDIRSVARSEIRFQETPEILIIGPEILRESPGDIAQLRRDFPDARILVRLGSDANDLSVVEQLARTGVDDTFSAQTHPDDVIRKLVILGGKRREKQHGRMILVDGGKGGVGCTTIAAAVAELIAVRGNKVAVLDFDFESQDLSRFLQCRPFVNENLQLLLDQQRPINQESVIQCLVQVFEASGGSLACMAPSMESEQLFSQGAQYSRVLLSICEVLDSLFDVVVVDAASARGAFLKTLYRVADNVVYVLSNDPACLYAAADKLTRYRSLMAADAELCCLVNSLDRSGLPPSVVKAELQNALSLDSRLIKILSMPFCPEARRWPGSGATAAGLSSTAMRRSFDDFLVALGFESAFSSKTVRLGEEMGFVMAYASSILRSIARRNTTAANKAVVSSSAVTPQLSAAQIVPQQLSAAPLALIEPAKVEAPHQHPSDLEEWEPSKLVSGISYR